jgi:hypothetical protein
VKMGRGQFVLYSLAVASMGAFYGALMMVDRYQWVYLVGQWVCTVIAFWQMPSLASSRKEKE